jgi:hypothetical protein
MPTTLFKGLRTNSSSWPSKFKRAPTVPRLRKVSAFKLTLPSKKSNHIERDLKWKGIQASLLSPQKNYTTKLMFPTPSLYLQTFRESVTKKLQDSNVSRWLLGAAESRTTRVKTFKAPQVKTCKLEGASKDTRMQTTLVKLTIRTETQARQVVKLMDNSRWVQNAALTLASLSPARKVLPKNNKALAFLKLRVFSVQIRSTANQPGQMSPTFRFKLVDLPRQIMLQEAVCNEELPQIVCRT